MSAPTTPTRREFIKTGALVTGGLVIAFTVPGAKRFARAERALAGDDRARAGR